MLKDQLDIFLYWIRERHSIYLKKEAGKKWPWTKDPILQEYKFTNPFRQNDAVTVELSKRLKSRDSKVVLFRKIVTFRMFNWPPTYDVLYGAGLIDNWSVNKAVDVLQDFRNSGNKVFTGAYMMTGSGSSGAGGKSSIACQSLSLIHRDAEELLRKIKEYNTLENAVELLLPYPMVGRFVAYEFVTDMRHTPILNKASDIYTWASPGPGAKRGIHRLLFGSKLRKKGEQVDYQHEMQKLLNIADRKLSKLALFSGTSFEMRDIEHSLCEFDKYMRVKNNEGKPRSRYHASNKG